MAAATAHERAATDPTAVSTAKTPLRIAGVDPERAFGGGEAQVMGLTLALLRAGHQAELICDPEGILWERARAAGIVRHALSIRNSVDIAAGLRLRALLSRQRYDVVHFHTARAHALAPYARGQARASVVTRRMDYPPNRLFAPWLYNRAVDGVAAISDGVAAALLRSGVARDHITMIPSGVDCINFAPPSPERRAEARANFGLAADEVAIGAVGALTERKGHKILIEAMSLATGDDDARATRERARLRCFIAGAGSRGSSLAAEIRQRGLDQSMHMLGQISDVRSLLWALDIFVMPSLNEGLGIALLEAMACGLPAIASAVGGMREAIDDRITGLLVAPADARGLAGAIISLTAAPQRRVAMGAAAQARVTARFGLDAMASRTLELYERCLANSARASK